MAEGAGKMALKNLRMQILPFAAADSINEILKVISAALESLHLLTVIVVSDGLFVAREDDVAVFAMDDIADAGAFEFVHCLLVIGIGGQTANFEDERSFRI